MLYVGKVANTHGLKGEIKILSNFKYKKEVFLIDNIVYINNEKLTIKSYRPHQKYDMITMDGYNRIEDVLNFKGLKVYIDENDYNFSGILNEQLIGLKVYDNGKLIGTVKAIEENGGKELMVIEKEGKEYLIPYIDEFVKNISDKIEVSLIKGLIDED